MIKYTNEELLDVLPSSLRESKELTTKQKVILGQFVVYNGLNIVTKDGYFYRSNKDLCSDCEVQEKTLILAVNKLEALGFIERKSGSRKDGASQYRINQKMIADYCKMSIDDNCKKEIEDYSNDYSKQIAEMSSRIKELENTVKRLAERITVIETANYSTDTDKEIDKDKEEEIINNNSLNNILEESDSTKELESEDSFAESLASSPIEDSTDFEQICTSTEDESISVEQQTIPTEDEQYQRWLQVINPYLMQLEGIETLAQFEVIKNRLKQIGEEYLESHDYTSSAVLERMNRTVGTALKAKKNKLIPTEMELSDYLRVHNYGSL